MNWLESQLQSIIKYDPKLQQQIPKEELERIRMEQIELELQSPQYIDTKIPEEMKIPVSFENELKNFCDDLIGCSQECEGTFKIKDGEVTDIHITEIALIPRFKDGVKE